MNRSWLVATLLAVFVCPRAGSEPTALSVLATMPAPRGLGPLDPALKARLRKERVSISARDLERITKADLKNANVVVVTYPGSRGRGVDPFASGAGELLREFVREGGGLFLIPGGSGGYYVPAFAETANQLLKPLGARVLCEPITDASNLVIRRFFVRYRFFKTTNVSTHPATKGVHSLVFSCGRREKHLETFAIETGPEWTVIVRGEPTACSHKLKGGNAWQWEAGSYATAPPIVAVRDYGRGRVALMGTTARYYIQAPFHRAFDGFVYNQGDGWRFFVQLIRWLAEPSVQNGRILRTLPPVARTREIAKPWPRKSEWLAHVLENLPKGFGPKYYIDCGDAGDLPFDPARGPGWTEGSEPIYGWHWARPLAYHATAGTVRQGRKVSYTFTGLSGEKAYMLGVVGWTWDGHGRKVKASLDGHNKGRWEWSWPSFTDKEIPQMPHWIAIPRECVSGGRLEVTFLPGAGEKGVAVGELWLLESGLRAAPPATCSVEEWESVSLPHFNKLWRGVIGAHSGLSDGEGSIEDWAAAAKRLGMNFLMFTENYDNMSAEKYERLVAECGKVSSKEFIAVPGLELSAPYGHGKVHGVCVNPKAFPTREKGLVFKLKFHYGSPLMVNPFEPGTLSPWQFRFWEGVQVWRYDARGEHDAWSLYEQLASAGYNVHPYVVHSLRSPAALEKIKGWRVYFLARQLPWIRPGGFRFRFISNGPEIEQFAVKKHRGGGEFAGEWVRVSLRASADDPLRSVTLLDRGHVLRKFYPRSREFAHTVVFPADQWRVLRVEVEDAAGRRAMSDHVNVAMMHFGIPQCNDNQNNIFEFYSPEGVGHVLLGAGHVGQDAGSITNSLWLEKEINPPGQEGGELAALRCQAGSSLIRLFTNSRQWLYAPRPRLRNLFWSEDAVVFDYTAESDVGSWRATFTGFRPRLHGFNWLLTDTRLTLKKSVPLGENGRGPEILFKHIRGNGPVGPWPKVSYWAGRGERSTAAVPDKGALHLRFPAISGICCWPNKAGNFAMLATDGEADAWVYGPNDAPGIAAGRKAPNAVLKPGTTLHATLITVIDSGEAGDDSQLSQFSDFLGIGGEPGFQVRVTHGVLRTANPVVLAEAENGNATFEFKCNHFLTPVGVIVRGVAPYRTSILCDLDSGWWKPLGVYRGAAYAVIERAGQHRMFVGNPLRCDHPSLRVEWLRAPGPGGVPRAAMEFRVHNPTPHEQRCRISLASALSHLFGTHQWDATIPAGATQYFSAPVR